MPNLRRIHLYLGCLFAPVLVFFAISGSWQLFNFHRGTKDGSYEPPRAVAMLSGVHQYQHLPGTSARAGTPLKYFVLAAATGLVLTTLLGVTLALRGRRDRLGAVLCLVAGVALPVGMLLVFR